MLQVPKVLAAASLLFPVQNTAGLDAHAAKKHVVLTNNTPMPIVEIYVADDAAHAAANWQEDLLGPEFLLPGDSVSVYVDDKNGNCRVHVKAVFDDGSTFVNRAFNPCRVDGIAVPIR